MKKNLFFAAFVLAAVFSACQVKESIETPASGPKMIEVRAVIADGELTKTTLDEGSPSFHWSETDKIVAWNGTEATKDCAITSLDDNGVATFEVPEGTQWVIYPSRDLTVASGVATWTRSTNQYFSEDGSELIGDGSNPMFGKLEGGILKFTNMCGYIQFQLTGGKTLHKFSFKTNNVTTPAITGKADINVSEEKPVLTYPVLFSVAASGVAKYGYINLSGRDIALGSEPVSIFVVVPPATYEGSEIVLEFTDGTSAAVIASNEIKVDRNKVTKVKPINVDSLFPETTVALDEGGRSNCYMVIAGNEPQYYSFTAQKIVSGDTFEGAKVASTVWAESKTMLNNFTFDANTNKVTFKYCGGGQEGNAVIGIDQNNLGTAAALLWNYHIWVTDQPDNVLIDETDMPAPILDRNVGATWAPKNEAEVLAMTEAQWLETVGTYYQYGNHIPYPRLARAANSAANWDNIKVGVFYGFSNYCQRFANSGSSKATLAEQESYPNYQYHKSTGVKFGSGNETVWTQVVLRGGPTGEGENIWETKNGGSAKSTDYDPCPQGYCFISATHTYQATLNNECSTHKIGDKFFGKYNSDASEHFLYFPAAGYLGNSKNSLVNSRVVYWGYFVDKATDMGHIFRRAFMNEGNNSFKNDNQPFSSQAHNMRCALLATGE
ncbi:MAG: hypothetical protein J6O51_08230 [Bacteroidales bacterium]|nr:hypothetical protein [Bacteroidales bacterium]